MLKQVLIDKAVKLGQGVDNKGNEKDWVIDIREMILDPVVAPLIISQIKERIKSCRSLHVGGITVASSLLAPQLMAGTGLSSFYMRKAKKEYGLQKQIEGCFGDSVIIVDDFLNKGGAAEWAARVAEEHGAKVEKIVSVVSYENGGGKEYDAEALYGLTDLFLKTNLPKPAKPIILWKKPFKVVGQPVSDGSLIYIPCDDSLKCIDTNGMEIWNYKTGSPCTRPAIGNNIVFGTCDGFLHSITKDGRPLWKHRYGEQIPASPRVLEDIYVHTISGKRGALLCYDMDGKLKWNIRTDPNNFQPQQIGNHILTFMEKPLIVNDGIPENYFYDKKPVQVIAEGERTYILTEDGSLACLMGQLIWEKKLGRDAKNMVIMDNCLYVSTSKRIISLNKYTNSINWMINGDCGEISNGLAFSLNEKLCIAKADGSFRILDVDCTARPLEINKSIICAGNELTVIKSASS